MISTFLHAIITSMYSYINNFNIQTPINRRT